MTQNAEQDFDFFHGSWRVNHRRLTTRLSGSRDWQEFAGVCRCRPTLGGFGNFDDNIIDLPAGTYRAMTIRAFDPANRNWSIWWLDARHPQQLDVPVVGSFAGGTGSFLANDKFQGRDILVRFTWQKGPEPRWEQAMSADNGASWETNWTMDFTRDDAVTL